MVSVYKLGGTINQTGVKGGKSKRSKIPPQSLSFSFSPRPRFSRFAAHHSPLDEPRDVRSIALKTLGKERDCSQSTEISHSSARISTPEDECASSSSSTKSSYRNTWPPKQKHGEEKSPSQTTKPVWKGTLTIQDPVLKNHIWSKICLQGSL